jgi:hypothetical protein
MPNGASGGFSAPATQLQSWIAALPVDTAVAFVAAAAVKPVTGAALLQMLGHVNRTQIPSWIYEAGEMCELLLSGDRVRIAPESTFYRRLPRSLHKGYVDIPLAELEGELRQLEPESTIGTLETTGTVESPITAGELALRLGTHCADVAILEMEHGASYMLHFSSGEPRYMGLDTRSPLFTLLRHYRDTRS